VNIIKYEPDLHESVIQRWLALRVLSPKLAEGLPEIGFIVEDEVAIAAGFLRRMEGPFAMIDAFMTNPLSDSGARHQALMILTNRIIQQGKELNLKRIFAFSSDNSILIRAVKHKFEIKSDSMLVLDL
jgi:hypothetical protein